MTPIRPMRSVTPTRNTPVSLAVVCWAAWKNRINEASWQMTSGNPNSRGVAARWMTIQKALTCSRY